MYLNLLSSELCGCIAHSKAHIFKENKSHPHLASRSLGQRWDGTSAGISPGCALPRELSALHRQPGQLEATQARVSPFPPSAPTSPPDPLPPVRLVGVVLLPTLPSVAQSGLAHHQVRHLCPPHLPPAGRRQMQPLAAKCSRGHRWTVPWAGASGPGRGGVRAQPAPSRTALTTAHRHGEGHSGSALEASDRTAPSHGALPRPQ